MNKNFLPGLVFAILWATGSVAAKFGGRSADLLLLASGRFILTGIIFLPLLILQGKHRIWPRDGEWSKIFIYGLLNTTLTLGAFFASQKYVSAGISMLFLAVAPLVIALFSAVLLKRKLTRFEICGMLVSFTGLIIASFNEFKTAHVSYLGIVLLTIYMISYAAGSVYFSTLKLNMPNVAFNLWQVFIGGLMLLPFCGVLSQYHIRHFDANLLLSLIWMIIVLSVFSNQLWLYLIRQDPVKAAAWLYLVPVFGYVYGYLLLGETITPLALAGTALVITGLILSKRNRAVVPGRE
ncbi:hypothetical protein CKK33_01065 [Mucilaginibacter sp. MD40]|uniref:DMT family transporter n=1 Tax=Mucilaginibacter sp. MD40 TaxID=2029590 RepID=UPI000BACC970|nr:DMT family transporter [Mucilaginibacter sp. MD40]PAW92158.1 hypothetical protein CKK33_01065 [Mucilaginibacter sp. MD40]